MRCQTFEEPASIEEGKNGIGKSWLYGQFSEECIYDVMCYEMYSRVENMKQAVWDAERSPAGKVQGCNLHKIYCILSETGGHMKCIIVVLQYKNGR